MSSFELANKPSYLVLTAKADGQKYSIRISTELPPILLAWQSTTRISPIIGIKQFGTNDPIAFTFPEDKTNIIFLGPVLPIQGCLLASDEEKAWLTLGLYNFIIIPKDRERCKQILRSCASQDIRYECWTITKGTITKVECSKSREQAGNWRNDLSVLASKPVHPELTELVTEYCPLMATAISRAEQATPSILADLLAASEIIGSQFLQIEKEPPHNLLFETQGLLTTINAGLSRLTSQAYSGFSPIFATECHFLVPFSIRNRHCKSRSFQFRWSY